MARSSSTAASALGGALAAVDDAPMPRYTVDDSNRSLLRFLDPSPRSASFMRKTGALALSAGLT
jgi:hypothetical protein